VIILKIDKKVISAWEEEWAKIPIPEINKWVEDLEKQLCKVIDSAGDNSSHG